MHAQNATLHDNVKLLNATIDELKNDKRLLYNELDEHKTMLSELHRNHDVVLNDKNNIAQNLHEKSREYDLLEEKMRRTVENADDQRQSEVDEMKMVISVLSMHSFFPPVD
jgi:FtsZ-binding cell division protein ZapB